MFSLTTFCRVTAISLMLSAAGCASKVETAAERPTHLEPAPRPPAGASASFTVPSIGSDGRYVTINSGIGREEAVWHLRSAINVAALSCTGADERAIAAEYNALLKKQKKLFASAYKAEVARFRDDYGGEWQQAFDQHNTRLYNYFALPPAKAGFCRATRAVSADAASVSAADFPAFATAALLRLEMPFTAFYKAYDDYREELAAWRERSTRTALASNDERAPVKREAKKRRAADAAFASTQATAARAAPVPAARPKYDEAQSTGTEGARPAADWRIQLGAFGNDDAARTAWADIRNRSSAIAALEPRIEPMPAKGLVRLQAGPVGDRAAAEKLCNAAAAVGQGCFPVAPSL